MSEEHIQEFLKECENTYDYLNIGGGYFNVVGTEQAMREFLNWTIENDIWTYRLYTFCIFMSVKFKGIFCSVKDLETVKNYVEDKDLVLNASNPFF